MATDEAQYERSNNRYCALAFRDIYIYIYIYRLSYGQFCIWWQNCNICEKHAV